MLPSSTPTPNSSPYPPCSGQQSLPIALGDGFAEIYTRCIEISLFRSCLITAPDDMPHLLEDRRALDYNKEVKLSTAFQEDA